MAPARIGSEPSLGGVADPEAQTLAVPPPPQVCGEVHEPQWIVPPQPSEMLPQFLLCAAQVVGVHDGAWMVNLKACGEPAVPLRFAPE